MDGAGQWPCQVDHSGHHIRHAANSADLGRGGKRINTEVLYRLRFCPGGGARICCFYAACRSGGVSGFIVTRS